MKNVFILSTVTSLTILLSTSCGRKTDEPQHVVIENKMDDQKTPTDDNKNDSKSTTENKSDEKNHNDQTSKTEQQTQTSSQPAPTTTPIRASSPLTGLFQLVDNHQSRIRINDQLLIDTNLEIPHPSGNGTRVSPKFPHELRADTNNDWFTSLGYYNDASSVFKNVEIKVRLFNNDQLLDVSLVINDGNGQQPNPPPSQNNGCGCCCCCNWNPCDPCGPPQPCFQPCQPGTGGNPNPLYYQYRYERVNAASTSQTTQN